MPSRGTRGAIAAGTEYATEAGMRMYTTGGNAVDAAIASMFAAAVTEFSHFGMGGEAPILVRTKDGKVHAIAGVGTMPKLATHCRPDLGCSGRQGGAPRRSTDRRQRFSTVGKRRPQPLQKLADRERLLQEHPAGG